MYFDPNLLKSVDRVSAQYKAVHNEIERIWLEKMLFTWHWWFGVALSVLPWVLWLIVRNRKDSHNLLYAGLFTMLSATLLCILGTSQGLWQYNSWILPHLHQYFPWHLTVMPVTAMLFYQFLSKISPWIKGAVFSFVGAYVVEPIYVWLGFYETTGWEFYYGLPIYYAIYLVGYWLYTRRQNIAL